MPLVPMLEWWVGDGDCHHGRRQPVSSAYEPSFLKFGNKSHFMEVSAPSLNVGMGASTEASPQETRGLWQLVSGNTNLPNSVLER